MYILSTSDSINFAAPGGVTNPVYTFPGAGGVGTTTTTEATNVIYSAANALYYVAYEYNDFSGTTTSFGISTASSLNGPWTWLTDVSVFPGCVANCYVWNPRWFIDDDNSVHIVLNGESTVAFDSAFQPYILDALNSAYTSWSAATAITGTFPADMIDAFPISRNNSPNGLYNIWYKIEGGGTHYIEYMSSSSLKSGYTVTKSGDWTGVIGGIYEGPMLTHAGTRWRLVLDNVSGGGGLYYLDSYDNWATWVKTPVAIVAPIATGTASFVQNAP